MDKPQHAATAITKKEIRPLTIFDEVRQMLDEPLFSRFPFHYRRPLLTDLDAAAWSPKVDIAEKDGKLVVKVDLPGVKKEDIKVSFQDGALVLEARRESEREVKEGKLYRSERESGEYYRSIPLPEGVKAESIQASYKDGVLDISLEVPTKPGEQKVSIKVL
jgi:HSP20 family protein